MIAAAVVFVRSEAAGVPTNILSCNTHQPPERHTLRAEQINRGRMTVAGTQMILSHVRITNVRSYDEVAYRDASNNWELIASYLSATEAAAVFAALNGAVVDRMADITIAAAAARDAAGTQTRGT